MTREHKLALILGFSIVLVVGVLVSDHLSGASVASLEEFADAPPSVGEPLIAPGQAIHDEQTSAASQLASAAPRQSPVRIPDQADTAARAPTQRFEPVADGNHDSGFGALVDAVQRQMSLNGSAPAASVVPSDAGDSPARNADPATPTERITATAHLIDDGETLWAITGAFYGEPRLYERVAAFNRSRIDDPTDLEVGATLYLPDKRALETLPLDRLAELGRNPAPRTSAAAAPPKPTPSTGRTYVVQKGDILGDISLRLLGTSKRWREILELNPDRISNPDRVPAGVVLRIPER